MPFASQSFFTAMPPPPPPPPPSLLHHPGRSPLLPPLLAASIALAFFSLSLVLYRKITRRRTVPADPKPPFPPQRFSFPLLRRATASFSAANRLGQGGFGPVYKGTLPSGQEIAVKLMCEASIQGEREFHNELSLASAVDTACCPHVVCVLGFSTSENNRDHRFRHRGRRKKRRGRKLALVYEFMTNGSLQDALLDRKCPVLMHWNKRFSIIISIAKALEYLHSTCDPPIVHGDVKPSNVLLDSNFDAKISDFGLAQVLNNEILEENENENDYAPIIEDDVVVDVDQSLDDSCCVRITDGDVAGILETSQSEGLNQISVDSSCKKGVPARERGEDWWWKQENAAGLSDSGRVKDYVMEWIGSEINKEQPKKEWANPTSPIHENCTKTGKQRKIRKPREWWKEEFCDELTKKTKKRSPKSDTESELWWQGKRRRKSKGISRSSSIDSWLDGFSSEFRRGRRNSKDWTTNDIPKSGGISSTPSMRGTICYVAPEYGGGAQVSDKCDVYSFGVLLLVVVSGRRPLQVMGSPMSEFERANLISWSKQLAVNGKMLDLVDADVVGLDPGQAVMCVTIALLCLQRSPEKRPAMREIVGMLSGESEPPGLPVEFSPSPPGNFPFKSRKKVR